MILCLQLWLAHLLDALAIRWRQFRDACREPFDVYEDDLDSDYPDLSGPPAGLDCPDTQPTSPGALDSDLGRLQ